ncbi:hypothetical protein N7467_004932 [Penicillium canescens]|nr:hypothetical protein N7467_004932 [Penicillium canescens]
MHDRTQGGDSEVPKPESKRTAKGSIGRDRKLLLQAPGQAETVDEKGSRRSGPDDTVQRGMRKHRGQVAGSKNENNQSVSKRKLSEIKLKRTDTTLDLSQ